jgi:tetratricopeptide (TPR) repeat protein
MRVEVWSDSLALWKDAEAKSPELARPHLNLGMAYQAAGIDDRAMEEYRHALAVNPRLAPAYIDMAGIFFQHDDLDSSETALKKAMDLAPALPAPYINLAQVEAKRGKPEEALNILNRAPLTSLSYLVHINKGDIYEQLGRCKEAVTEYQEASRLRPDLREVTELTKQRIDRLKEYDVNR